MRLGCRPVGRHRVCLHGCRPDRWVSRKQGALDCSTLLGGPPPPQMEGKEELKNLAAGEQDSDELPWHLPWQNSSEVLEAAQRKQRMNAQVWDEKRGATEGMVEHVVTMAMKAIRELAETLKKAKKNAREAKREVKSVEGELELLHKKQTEWSLKHAKRPLFLSAVHTQASEIGAGTIVEAWVHTTDRGMCWRKGCVCGRSPAGLFDIDFDTDAIDGEGVPRVEPQHVLVWKDSKHVRVRAQMRHLWWSPCITSCSEQKTVMVYARCALPDGVNAASHHSFYGWCPGDRPQTELMAVYAR